MRRMLLSLLLCGLLVGTAAAQPVLYDFYADWCGPCRSMTAMVDRLIGEGYAVERVNVDRQPELAARYGVQSIPCFVWVEDGLEVDRVTGIVSVERLKWHGKPATIEKERTKIRPEPRPAWRYERAEGHRASVVRIFCEEAHGRSIGSGTLVRWNGRVVVVTARHVVQGAGKIVVELCTRKTHYARVLKMDPTWDCAVLELMGRPVGVPVAEIELGPSATQKDGDRLESCGYGPDGKLAVNSGLFLGYRRSTAALQGPDDWMVISGRARPGDSGGPVFNARGRLVGVLWGTDGEEVVCVQAGRLHLVLEAAVPAHAYQQRAYQTDDRCPTPPMPGPIEEPKIPCGPGCGCTSQSDGRQPILPGNRALAEDKRIEQEMAALRGQIGRLEQALTNAPKGTATDPQVLSLLNEMQGRLAALEAQRATPPPPMTPPAVEKSPGNAIEQKVDDLLHRLPIQGPVTKLEEKQLESEHPLQRFFGATAAIVFLTVVGTLILVAIVLLGHKIYQGMHAKKAEVDAKLGSIPVVGSQLQAAFDKLDAINTNTVDPKITAILDKLSAATAAAKAQADAALQVGTQAALAAVPGAAPVAAGAVAVQAAVNAAAPTTA